jgi:hypothetical protein
LGKNVELRAARKIEWDMRLDAYRDDSQYTPEDLEALWRKKLAPAAGGNAPGAGSGSGSEGK